MRYAGQVLLVKVYPERDEANFDRPERSCLRGQFEEQIPKHPGAVIAGKTTVEKCGLGRREHHP
jgi:hypothetical protein